MLPLETLGAFFVTAIVMGLAPGPDNIFGFNPVRPVWLSGRYRDHVRADDRALRAYGSRCPRRCGTLSNIRDGLYSPEMCRGGLPAVSGMAFFP